MPGRRSGLNSTYGLWLTRFAIWPRRSTHTGKIIWFEKIHIFKVYQIVDGPQLEILVDVQYYTTKEKILRLITL